LRKHVPALLLAALVFLVFMPNLALLWRHPGLVTFVRGVVVSGLLCAAVFAILGRRLWLACLLFLPFAALAPAETYYILRYDRPSDANIMATVFESNLREASEFLGAAKVYLALAIALALIEAVAAVRYVRWSGLAWTHRSRYWVVAIAVGVPVASALLMLAQPKDGDSTVLRDDPFVRLKIEIYMTYPFGLVERYRDYKDEWAAMRMTSDSLAAFRFGAHPHQTLAQRQIYVLVIGEASRRDHWSLFGYVRPTNPELGKIENLVALPDMITPWTASRFAVPVIVSRKPATDLNAFYDKEPSIARVFQEAGFETFWYSTQTAVGTFDSPISVAAFDAMTTRFFNPSGSEGSHVYDDALLEPLRASIRASDRNLFVVLHTLGSHQQYDSRYPPSFNRFVPTRRGDPRFAEASSADLLTNAYDNSVLFTDHFLSAVINILGETPAITAMFYVSDHGEMLPNRTCNAIGHGISGLPDYTVAAVFWYSQPFAERFPDKVEALRSHADRPLSTTNVFESLVDMADLDFPGHAHEASFFDPGFSVRQRLVQSNSLVDFDHKALVGGCQIVVPEQAAPQ
jgi:glucan phosphoethanolaminetransferase (alkaline phosphatase superfamily)